MEPWQAQAYSRAFGIIAQTDDVLGGMRRYNIMGPAYWTSLNKQLADIAKTTARIRQIGDRIRKQIDE